MNIETYFNELDDNIEEIRVENKRLSYIPSLLRFKKLKLLICSGNNLTTLPDLPETLEVLCCAYNKLHLFSFKTPII